MSRYLCWSIVWSLPPNLKEIQQKKETKDYVVDILKKNCQKVLFAEEVGANDTNYHYDITAMFNNAQKANEVRQKLKGIIKKVGELDDEFYFKKPALFIRSLSNDDLCIRAGGYGSKEGQIYYDIGFTPTELEEGKRQYEAFLLLKQKSGKMKCISSKFIPSVVEKWITSGQIDINSRKDLMRVVLDMNLAGYIFDASPKTATRLFNQMLRFYLGKTDEEDKYDLNIKLQSYWGEGNDFSDFNSIDSTKKEFHYAETYYLEI